MTVHGIFKQVLSVSVEW